MQVDTIATLFAILLAIPLLVLSAECWLSLLPLRRQRFRADQPAKFEMAVVIPAHNEADGIAETVQRIKQQVDDNCQVIVVADNCNDATAAKARAAGATVWERNDPERRGKGYALNFAWENLAKSPPDVVVCIDADCAPGPDCIPTIARLAYERGRPIQSGYIMHAPPNASGLSNVSALAVYVKNYVRPRGLQWLRLPCLLTGSGMAFPAAALAIVQHPGGHIVEDLQATIDFGLAGFAPLPCMEVSTTSPLPTKRSGLMSQRTRWEHGHMRTILTQTPRLVSRFLVTGSLSLLATAVELAVPPLSLLIGISIFGLMVFTAIGFATANWWPLLCLATAATMAALGMGLTWLRHGREILPGRMIVAEIPRYIGVKTPMYLRFLSRPQTDWVRTERSQISPRALDGSSTPHSRTLVADSTPRPSEK